MEFGVDIPGTVKGVVSLDKANENNIWQDEIKLDMKNSSVAFKLCNKGEKYPVGHTKITSHLIYIFKIDMTSKAQYVAGGHLTDVPTYMTYSSVVSRDMVFIGFLMDALKNLDFLASDIQNTFLESPTKEHTFFYAGYEWKAYKEKVVIAVRSLYDLKYPALQFRISLDETLGNRIGYKSSLADPDLW